MRTDTPQQHPTSLPAASYIYSILDPHTVGCHNCPPKWYALVLPKWVRCEYNDTANERSTPDSIAESAKVRRDHTKSGESFPSVSRPSPVHLPL